MAERIPSRPSVCNPIGRGARRPAGRHAALLLTALLAPACGSPPKDPAAERQDLLLEVWQDVRVYFDAVNRNDVELVRTIKQQLQPRVDARLPMLQEFLLRGSPEDRFKAAGLLGFSTSRQVIPILIEALKTNDEYLRYHACLSLGTYGYVGTPAEPVVRLLADPSKSVRQAAAWVLARILLPGQGSLFLIDDDIQDWPGFCLQMAREADGKKPAPGRRIMELLPRQAQDLIAEVAQRGALREHRRFDILRGLNGVIRLRNAYQEKEFDGIDIPPAARELLNRPRTHLTNREVETLNRLLLEAAYSTFISPARGRERGWALAALLKALDDEEIPVRCEVMIALRRLGSPEAVDPLIDKGLMDNDRRIRMNAASALGVIGDPRAVEPLLRAMRDNEQDPAVLAAIKFGLREITSQDFGGSYTNWKTWWDEQKQPTPKMPGQEMRAEGTKKEESPKDAAPSPPAKSASPAPPAPSPTLPAPPASPLPPSSTGPPVPPSKPAPSPKPPSPPPPPPSSLPPLPR
jgi:hypothetical protein